MFSSKQVRQYALCAALVLPFALTLGAMPAQAQDQVPKPIQLPPPPPDDTGDTAPTPAKKPAAKPTTKTTKPPAAKADPTPSTQTTPTPDTAVTTAVAPDADGAPTFGFYAGETKAQILAAIGKVNLLKTDGDILEVAAAPKPDPNFDSFLLIVGPKQGLVKLIASGKDIDGDASGKQMKVQFTAMKDGLTKLYGDPSDNFDFIDSKSTLKGGNSFMLALTKTERTLSTYWTKKDFGNKITSIELEGNGLGNEKGYLSLEYEFAGYRPYLLSRPK